METKEKTKISSLVDQLVVLLVAIDEEIKRSAEISAEDGCFSLAELHRAKGEMSVVYDSAVAAVADAMADVPEITLADGTKIEKKSGSDRKKWDHDGLARNVASRINDMAVDLSTGEVIMSSQDMMIKMLDFAAVSYWRVKELSKIGVSADSFCEVSEAKTNVIVRRPKE